MTPPVTKPPLRPDQYDRYRRHLSLPEMGLEGQEKLLDSSVLLIGAGGLGCPLALYLAAAGVGRLGLVDNDTVDTSNLQRQILYRTDDVGRSKVAVAQERVHALNPDVEVIAYETRLSSDNALEIFADYDVVVDGTDNFPTRYLSNDACVLLGKPNVYGSIFRFEGQASVFDARTGPCYRCLFPEPPPPGAVPSCAEGGVLGVLPGIIATIQATEAIKLLIGRGRSLSGRLLLYDALSMEFNEFQLKKDPDCPVCGESPSIKELIDYHGFCGLPGAGEEPEVAGIAASELQNCIEEREELLLLDVRGDDEFERARIDGATLIPVEELAGRMHEISSWRSRRVVVMCHLGGRSERACRMLTQEGFASVKNLEGGIDAWSLTVDPGVERY
ncbi:MAG: molybdopterin-synthase adenylyltransferase MoeB [bacterium]|nr:molybdopterin-synthase adenylyltransferase MoeB [bacterium]